MKTVITLIIFAPAFWFLWLLVRSYWTSEVTGWQRVWFACKHSATIAWAQLIAFIIAIANGIGYLAEQVSSDPSAAYKLQDLLAAYPEYVAGVGVAIMVLTMVARLRPHGPVS